MPTLLIVDDEPTSIRQVAAALAGVGDTCFAMNGKDALALIDDRHVDLVLLDGLMPGLDGFELCPMLLERRPDMPVIFITAASDHDSEVRALTAGAVDFITKPVNPLVVRLRVGTQLKLKAQADQLREMTITDPLTRLLNRRALDDRTDHEWVASLRQMRPISMLLIDIDYFKRFNDRYGHLEGDICLQKVAGIIQRIGADHGGLAARYGGEEFALLLPGADPDQARQVGEAISCTVHALKIEHEASRVDRHVTVSVGVGSYTARDPGERTSGPVCLFRWADQALYEAKMAGRNRVCAAGSDRIVDSWLLTV